MYVAHSRTIYLRRNNKIILMYILKAQIVNNVVTTAENLKTVDQVVMIEGPPTETMVDPTDATENIVVPTDASTFINIVQDDNIIKSKMDILIGQKRKNQNKKQEQVTKLTLASVADINDQEQIQEFKYSPNDPSKVIYLDNFAFIEQVDYRMRLVTHNYELYY